MWYSNDELYDLEEDPGETRSVAEERPDIVRELRGRLEQVLLSIDQVDYGDLQRIEQRRAQFGEEALKVFNRLRAWGFYRAFREAELSTEEDTML
ncbi:MAG: hypothetical protein DRN06_07395 [Thermoprotei archaeon]|nr:MAG: hypothetical protein DRN06_07395 [Thermoprotei archaeon]